MNIVTHFVEGSCDLIVFPNISTEELMGNGQAYIRPNFDVLNKAILAWKTNLKKKIVEEDTESKEQKPAPVMGITQSVIVELQKVLFLLYKDYIQRLLTEIT